MNIKILIILCISIFSTMVGIGIVFPIIPIYAKNLGASGKIIGMISSSVTLTLGLCTPIVGRISDRVGHKKIITLGLGMHVPIALSYIAATNPYHLISIRLVEGVFAAMVAPITMAYMGAIAPKNKEGSYMGIFNSCMFLGIGAGPLLGGYLTNTYNIQAPFYAMAGITAFAFLLAFILLPGGKHSFSAKNGNKTVKVDNPIKMLLSSDIIKGMLIFGLIIFIAAGGILTFYPLLTRKANLTTFQIGLLTSIFLFCAGILQIPFGLLANKFNNVFLIMGGVIVMACTLACIPLFTTFWIFLILLVINGTATAIAQPSALALIVKGGKDIGLGFTFGIYNTISGVGFTIGPIIFGFIMDSFGLNYIFYTSSVLFFIASFAIYYFTRNAKNL